MRVATRPLSADILTFIIAPVVLLLILLSVSCSPQLKPETANESLVMAGAEVQAFAMLATSLVRQGKLHSNDAAKVLVELKAARATLSMIAVGVDENGDPLSEQDGLRRFYASTSIALKIMGPLVNPDVVTPGEGI